MRRTGRFRWEISCPKMVVKRGQCFRAVDSNDQMRMSDIKFDIISRNKAWPVVHWGVHELIIVDIWLICRVSALMKNIPQHTFRWQLLVEILDFAKSLESNTGRRGRSQQPTVTVVDRFSPNSVSLHHFDNIPEYVTAQELDELHDLHREDATNAPPVKRSRSRDEGRVRRMTGEQVFRNPYWHAGQCVVCWARGKRRMTSRYCRECSEDRGWTFTSRRGGTFNRYKPRLCSDECWIKFHTSQVYGLDYQMRTQRHSRARGRRSTPITVQSDRTPPGQRSGRMNIDRTSPMTVNFDV